MNRWVKSQSSWGGSSSYKKDSMLPRLTMVKNEWTLKQIHMRVFEHLRWLLSEWCDYKDPNTTKEAGKGGKYDLRKDLPPFPYRPAGWEEGKTFTAADFDAMTIEDQFNMCFSGLVSGDAEKANKDIADLEHMPY